MNPLPAADVLDRYFLEARSKLLDLAAILDRINRGRGMKDLDHDPRLRKIGKAIEELQALKEGRAERIQQIFSLEYDQRWDRPRPS